ncbi:major capsid protein [Microcystis phage Mae-JY09]
MPQINTAADISSPYIQTIYDDAMFVVRETVTVLPWVTTFNDRSGLASRSSSEYNSATMNVVGEADDLTSQAFTPSVIATLTPFERAAQFLITDSRVESDPWDSIQTDASRELGASMANTMDTDLVTNFTSLTGGTVGAAGSAMTWGYLAAAVAILRGTNVPGPYYAVLHPYQALDLANAAANMAGAVAFGGDATQDAAARGGILTGLGAPLGLSGITISANIDIDGSDDAVGAVFNPMAMAMDMRRAPRLEPQRDASRRSTELNLSAVYAHGVWRPKFGVQIKSDASLPA